MDLAGQNSPPASDNTQITLLNRRFEPGMFLLTVGSEKRLFEVHKAVLCQSPVLAAMCNSKFKEAQNRHIELPDDDSVAFGQVLEYLYAHDFVTAAEEPGDIALELAEMYIVADKYQLNILNALTVEKLRANQGILSSALALFPAAQRIYDHVPNSDSDFKNFFKEIAPSCVSELPAGKLSDFVEVASFDGQFGKDVIRAFFIGLQRAKKVQKAADLAVGTLRRKLLLIDGNHNSNHLLCWKCM
ncbi:MAG: hypothetical protein M1812_001489 [Candelaria pacifica]|nr:MAG: hypothetical protein M1812_001489 [Candelaria pacifica]